MLLRQDIWSFPPKLFPNQITMQDGHLCQRLLPFSFVLHTRYIVLYGNLVGTHQRRGTAGQWKQQIPHLSDNDTAFPHPFRDIVVVDSKPFEQQLILLRRVRTLSPLISTMATVGSLDNTYTKCLMSLRRRLFPFLHQRPECGIVQVVYVGYPACSLQPLGINSRERYSLSACLHEK